ncbi:protein of unknown function UPF0182 [Nitrosococcus halophilus Nc 4]|uniref:UPF0182 protein Nhal_1535 n=1 Tax=Nitrosococcus halophilus (strain Nc4) TaxID=472759 RepID=D5C1P3_NITHN|nr:UPF0182 family protein [Nitrosococcus halophilus]ADE14676.1 protein of unknown function UPF0182 [Nitrosococcus halophilus Nc 4]
MSRWKHRLFILGFSIIAFFIFLIFAGFEGIPFLVDLWWFDAQGYGFYFWQRMLYQSVVFIEVGILFFLVFFLNFWIASHYLGTERPAEIPPGTPRKSFKRLFNKFQTGSLWVYTPFSVVLSILVAWPLFQQWEAFLLYLMAPDMGVQDPAYGKDISYYLFSFPIYVLILQRLLIALLLLLLGLALLYWIENRLLSQHGKRLPLGARWHLSILVLFTFLIEIWDFVLQRNELVYSEAHQPLFSGPGFVEMRVILPFIWLSLFFLLGVALSLVYFINRHKGIKLLVFFSLFFMLSLGARHFHFLHWATQEYIVKPNELSLQKPFIEGSIQATLDAYNLSDVEVREFERERILENILNTKVQDLLRNIPVWDKELVGQVYRQLQQLRTYYSFPSTNVDRYMVNGKKHQVFLGARELNYEKLPSGARKWVNEHLLYTHGYGPVMTSAGQGRGEASMDWFIREIPPESDQGFNTEQPGIYYGLGPYRYAIAPNENRELDYPKGNTNVMTDYQGRGGVSLSSLFEKLVFYYYFQDSDIFFTTQTHDKSKILFRRNITERIETLTPYLLLDASPYLAVTPKGLYWIQDAYTASTWYPNADRLGLAKFEFPIPPKGNERINYIRNSVKIVVDAYHGTVDYYVFDSSDPIIQAYSRIYPGLFKSKEQMPADIRAHVRYPKDLFEIQMGIYAKYHQTDVEVFYQQEDVWSFAQKYNKESETRLRPYYLTLDLIKENRFDFLLFLPMLIEGQDNMRAMMAAGSDEPYYGKLIAYSFPKGELVFGPSQINTLINENPEVSAQFTLWSQNDSEVALGAMIIMPVGQVVLYIQPVFLTFKGEVKIPQLQRIIISDGQFVVMEPTLMGAYIKLKERIEAMGESS